MVNKDINNPLLNWMIESVPRFNQIMSDEELINDKKAAAMCRLYYDTDVRKLGG